MVEKPHKEKKPEIQFNSEHSENVFSDIVKVNVTNETVSLEFGVKKNDQKSAIISHNVILTLPHFFRFADVCKNAADKLAEQINQIKEEK